jgi:hypothetical protein
MARSNGDLIAKARQMCEDAGRRPATVAEARDLLGVSALRARREPAESAPSAASAPTPTAASTPASSAA